MSRGSLEADCARDLSTGRGSGLDEGETDKVRQLTFGGAGIFNGFRMGSICEVTGHMECHI